MISDNKRKIHSRNRGFTLIELLVVIAIIGILGAVMLASLTSAREKSRDAKRIADISQISRALQLYYDNDESYPTTTPLGYTGDDAAIQLIAAAGFFSKTPPPPLGVNQTYIYHGVTKPDTGGASECTVAPSCNSFELGITLERSDNVVLTADADQSVGTFYGVNPDCLDVTAGDELCYDITP